MKKIIKNKVYDTATATFLFRADRNPGDKLYSVSELLYRKKTGEYFLHGYGGPGSKYAEPIGNNSWSGGETLIPLSYSAAREWAEENLTGEEYKRIFGPVAEDDSRVTVNICLHAANAEKAKRTAAARGISLSALIDELLVDIIN